MNTTRFARLILLLIALSVGLLMAYAQTPTRSFVDLPGAFGGQFYRGNPIAIRVQYPALVTNVRAVYRRGKGLAPIAQQPAVIDSVAGALTLFWASSVNLPDAGWLELYLNNKVSAAGILSIGYQTTMQNARTDTLKFMGSSQAPLLNMYVTAGGGATAMLTKFFAVSNVSQGYILPNHGVSSALIAGYFIRGDTKLVDPIWQPAYHSPTNAVLKGPPLETATGTVVLHVYLNQP